MTSIRRLCVPALLATAVLICSGVSPAAAQSWPSVSLAPLYTFDKPVHATGAGDGSGRLFVVELTGKIQIVKNGGVLPTPFIDLTDRLDCGDGRKRLLSVAFPPNYATSGHFYVKYLDKSPTCNIVVSRFTKSANPDIGGKNATSMG